jgi:hypothetical protein
MIRLKGEDRPTYVLSYPRWVRLARLGLVVLLAGAAVVRWILAWIHFIQPLTQGVDWAYVSLRPLVSAHLSLLFAAGAVTLVCSVLPDLSLADAPSQDPGTGGGIAVRILTGWHLIPWTTISAVRIVTFETLPHKLVVVQGNWTRWSPWPRLVSACLGAGLEPGFFFTTSIRDFEPLVQSLLQKVQQANPESLVEDEFFSLPAHLVLAPTATLTDLVAQAKDEGWPVALSAQAMAAVAGAMLLVQLLLLILMGGVWWNLLGIPVLVALEWGFGALYLYALSEIFPAQIELRETALLYPLPQVPRALLTMLGALFVSVGLPFLTAMIGLAGILWAVTLTALLVQQMYRLESILPALVGGAFQALFQFLSWALILTA